MLGATTTIPELAAAASMFVWSYSCLELAPLIDDQDTRQTRCAYLVLKSMTRREDDPRLMSRARTVVESVIFQACAKTLVWLLRVSDSTASVGIWCRWAEPDLALTSREGIVVAFRKLPVRMSLGCYQSAGNQA